MPLGSANGRRGCARGSGSLRPRSPRASGGSCSGANSGYNVGLTGMAVFKKEAKGAWYRGHHRHHLPHIAGPDLPAGVRDHLAKVFETPKAYPSEGSEPRPATEGAQEPPEARSWWRRWFGD
jgi:hypothetical protein